MGGKAERRLVAVDDAVVALRNFRRVGDHVRCGCADALDGKLVEMRELYRDAAEIVPDAGEDLLDLGVGFFREGCVQIIAADAVLGQ